uniref:TPR_REGION domain-containing protein n=1 Tax=Schistocephalus solidus TaxID=70667 RepID=A0A183THQ6_SCHSO
LRVSSEKASSGLTIKPLLENIVESFVLRCLPLPPHLTSIKFASCKLLANCCMKDNELGRALKLLIQAIQLDSTDLSLWFKVASASIKLCQTELATSALLHILNERPSHPFALHLAMPFFLGISELETCLELSVRSLVIDPANEAAIYCIQRVLQLQPSLEYLAERVLISEYILHLVSSNMVVHDSATESMLTTSLAQTTEDFRDSKPGIVLIITIIYLSTCKAINSVLDLASLFPDGVLPEQKTKSMESSASPAAVQEVSPTEGVSDNPPSSNIGSQPPGAGETDSSDNLMETDEASASPEAPRENPPDVTQEEYDSAKSLSLSRARRNRRIAAEKWRLGAASTGQDSSPTSGSDACIAADGSAVSSRRIRTGTSVSHQLHRRHDHRPHHKQKWTDLTMTLRSSLLPASYREVAHVFEREYLENYEELPKKAVVDGDCTDRPSALEEGKCYNVGGDRQQEGIESESNLVVEFLRVAQDETVNVVTLGVALLLQLSAVEKPWSLRFATAYLELSTRIRPSLPAWSPNYIESDTSEQCHTANCGTYKLIPASLIRLRSRPSPSQLARLHLTYLEVRLDALVYMQSSSTRHAVPEVPLGALANAILADSKSYTVFLCTDFTPQIKLFLIMISPCWYGKLVDFLRTRWRRKLFKLEVVHPSVTDPTALVIWIKYELSSLAHDYESMREYLLQVKEFVSQNGPFLRASSTRSHLINSARISELLTEVDDLTAGDRLLALSNIGDFEALISCFEEYLCSCSTANRRVPSSASRSVLHCDKLCRISSVLRPPLLELYRRTAEVAKQLNDPDDEKERAAVDAEENTVAGEKQRQLSFVLRCYNLGLRTISFLLLNTVHFERLSAFKVLPDDQKATLEEALYLGTVALDLLHNVEAEDSGLLQDFRVRDPVLTSQLQYSAEAAKMEVIQLPGLVRVDSPGLRSVKECRQDYGLVHLQFGIQLNTVVIPYGGL